ncbi:MAG: YkgJ family cysteine cluster protein [Bdellovibrionia bacterium]
MSTKLHPFQNCGACCAKYRVSFHWSETLPDSFNVPVDLTYPITPHLVAMRTDSLEKHRCVALKGEVGNLVSCSVYLNRPTPCREFAVSYENGLPNERCDQARASRGLKPLTPSDWVLELSETQVRPL